MNKQSYICTPPYVCMVVEISFKIILSAFDDWQEMYTKQDIS